MRPEEYPPQEPFSEAAKAYHQEVMRRGAKVIGDEVRYGADPYQSILLCRPRAPNGTMLAFLHGGGWTNGYKEWMAFMAPAFTDAGIVFASVGYRLAPAHLFPVGYEDACRGVRWISENAAQYGGRTDRLFVGGHSAGGHYAALMALQGAVPDLRGCLPIAGVYDFGAQSGLTMRPRFLGPADSGHETAANPMLHVGAHTIPFLITNGSDDFPHLFRQAERMGQVLAAAGADVERIVLNGLTHFTASYAGGEADGPWVPKALDWMDRHLQ
jgi:acetyl esterase/lipase